MGSRFVIAACMWGIAACVLVYRYAMLPLDWQSPARHVVVGVVIGLVAGARVLWRSARNIDAKRPPVIALIASAAVAAAIAFGVLYVVFPSADRAPLAKRQFPGFELSVPEGELVQDSLDYTAGQMSLKNVAGQRGWLAVQWEPGTELTDDEIAGMAKGITAALGNRVAGEPRVISIPGGDGQPVRTIAPGNDGIFAMSLLRCGVRHVVVTTAMKRALDLHRRIVASFVCRADPARDARARVVIPLWLDLPGWYAAPREFENVELSDGALYLILRPIVGGTNLSVETLVKAGSGLAGGNVTIGPLDGDRVRLQFHEDGQTMYGWAQLFTCPRGTVLVIGVAENATSAEALHARVNTAARCLRDGEPPQEWPAAPHDDAMPGDGAPAPTSP